MSTNHCLVWNARGLNNRARRSTVRSAVEQQRAAIVCIQETKVQNYSVSLNCDVTGIDYDYACLPAAGVAGGAVTAWRRDLWSASSTLVLRYSVTVRLTPLADGAEPWYLTNVYGPTVQGEKDAFLQELRDVRASCPGSWLVCGDFNLIYRAADKNNGRLHRSSMRRFQILIDDLRLVELHLSGRLFTWSNGRQSPTLERLDRAFASLEWATAFPCHHLRCLSSDASDHAPLFLVLNSEPWARPRFRFDNHWIRIQGFMGVVSAAWAAPTTNLYACRTIDIKLRALARALRSWRATHVGDIKLQLAAARVVIYEFDTAQESRALSTGEIELRRELKAKVLGLASLERSMARQRARLRSLREGDACTKYFHLQACHRRRKNYLFAISHGGQTFTEDEAKAGIVFSFYDGLLGTSFTRLHRINLALLNIPTLQLDHLVVPFTEEEISRVVADSPSDRAPGPDGFSGAFFKVAWTIVGADINSVFEAFWNMDFRGLNLINEAMMVLLHKTEAPTGLKDYRPISLIHSVGKLITKTLATRLAPHMSLIVKHNQTAFIRGRHIHENFTAVQLTCRWLHARRHATILLKVDLAKAFDSVAWPFLLEVLTHIGFPPRWREWVSALLRTASTKVLVNGRPGRRICHARGLRQGDPLSPLLFVIIMDVLNALIEEADRRRALSPLPGQVIKHRASIYADDLVLFLNPSPADFTCIREILELFEGASGLSCNLAKCSITPISCTQEQLDDVLAVFPCKVQAFPATYLGVPLSITRLQRQHEQALVDRVASRIPTWKAGLLTTAGRATLTQTTLSAIPVHIAICCALSAWAIREIDRHRRVFLWSGTSTVVGGKCRVSWPLACSPRNLGGLGLPDLRLMGYALRLRWEWLRRTDGDAFWASLPCKTEKTVAAMFDASVTVQVGDGATARFWYDSWLPEGPLYISAPNLFQAVGVRRRRRTVREALCGRQWVKDITGAPTAAVLLEYFAVWDTVEAVHLDPLTQDRFVWKWTSSGAYTASSAYRAFFFGRTVLAGAKLVWKAAVPQKLKFFFWLALHNRLWTAERRKRHGLQPEATCSLCDQEDESVDHLLSSCPVTREVWAWLLGRVGFQHATPSDRSMLTDWWLNTRQAVPSGHRRAFDSAVIIVSWIVWNERNNRIFRGEARSVPQMCTAVADYIRELAGAGFACLNAVAREL